MKFRQKPINIRFIGFLLPLNRHSKTSKRQQLTKYRYQIVTFFSNGKKGNDLSENDCVKSTFYEVYLSPSLGIFPILN